MSGETTIDYRSIPKSNLSVQLACIQQRQDKRAQYLIPDKGELCLILVKARFRPPRPHITQSTPRLLITSPNPLLDFSRRVKVITRSALKWLVPKL
jgi:hypothetical protein